MKWHLFMLVVCACGARQTPVAVAFNPASLRADVTEATLEIMRGDCAGEQVYSGRLAISAATTAMPLPRLRAGAYAFRVRAYNRACMLVAESCTIHTLPLAEGATLRTVVDAVAIPRMRCQSSETCSDGICSSLDGGRDAALRDGPIDAQAMSDSGTVRDAFTDSTADTSISRCGDGNVELPELCDDGNTVTEACIYGQTSCSVCSENCQTIAGTPRFCGDNTVQSSNGENCDDGNNVTEPCGYGQASCSVCSATCLTVAGVPSNCGDNQVQSSEGENCDDGNNVTEACTYGQTSCTVCAAGCQRGSGRTAYCGDSQVQTNEGELCDDGNNATEACAYGMTSCVVCATGCRFASGSTAYCGDSNVQAVYGEECDDGNATTEVCAYGLPSCTVCSSSCRRIAGAVSYCGDGIIQPSGGENCDDSNNTTESCAYGLTSCTVCAAGCQSVAGATSYCGDGVVQTGEGEACDDASPASGCVNCHFQAPRTCSEWLSGGAQTSGVYAVDPDASGPGASFDVYCDMTSQFGGWTLVGTLGDARLLPNWDRYLTTVTAPGVMANRLHTQFRLIVGTSFRVGQQIAGGGLSGNIFELNSCSQNSAGCWYAAYVSNNNGDTYGAWLTSGGGFGLVPAGCASDQCPTAGGDRDQTPWTRIAIFGGDCHAECRTGGADARNGFTYWDYGDSATPARIGNRSYWSNATVMAGDNSLNLSAPDIPDYGQAGSAWRDVWIR